MLPLLWSKKLTWGMFFPFYLTQEEDEDDENGWMDGWTDESPH